MSEMRVTFLGTSASVPTKERGLPAVLVEFKGRSMLFDAGEGVQRQFMVFGRSFMRVEHIFISHIHGDHVFGLPGLLSTMSLYGRRRPLHLWVPARSLDALRDYLNAIPMGVDYPLEFHPAEPGLLLDLGDFEVLSYELKHGIPTLAYVLREKPIVRARRSVVRALGIEGPLVARLKRGETVRLGDRVIRPEDVVYTTPGRKLVYATDTRPVYSELARGADLLIHEATYLDADREMALERLHSTAKEAAELASRLEVRQLVLTHFSPRIDDLTHVVAEASAVFPSAIAAHDGLTVEIKKPPRQ